MDSREVVRTPRARLPAGRHGAQERSDETSGSGPVRWLTFSRCNNSQKCGAGDAESFRTITEEECTEPHDAEVLGVATLTEQDLLDYPDSDYTALCDESVSQDPDREALSLSGEVQLLVIYDEEEAGEQIACLALALDGGQLDEPLVE